MSAYTIKLVQSTFGKTFGIPDLIRAFQELEPNFETIEFTQSSQNKCDIEFRWNEERSIRDIKPDGTLIDIAYRVPQFGAMSFFRKEKLCYIYHLGAKFKDLRNNLKPNISLAPIHFDLTSQLSSKLLQGRILNNVRVSDLPVDRIPSLTAEIPLCSIEQLSHLITDTTARITSLSVELRERTSVTIQIGGTIKYKCPSASPWSEIISEINPIIKHLK